MAGRRRGSVPPTRGSGSGGAPSGRAAALIARQYLRTIGPGGGGGS